MNDFTLPKRLRRQQKQGSDGQCMHANRICTDTRNTDGVFLKRRIYRCDDCGAVFHTAEIIARVDRWDDEKVKTDIIRRLLPERPEVDRYLKAIKRSAAGLLRVLDSNE